MAGLGGPASTCVIRLSLTESPACSMDRVPVGPQTCHLRVAEARVAIDSGAARMHLTVHASLPTVTAGLSADSALLHRFLSVEESLFPLRTHVQK
ncbi:hypothetical protein EDD90_10548 [Streptomyces sp. Ag109_O5-1]|nr:hypothetical protein EDD90_10548 [Streptomyces sp. Ag109_O5-1]